MKKGFCAPDDWPESPKPGASANPAEKGVRERILSAAAAQWPKYAGVALAALSVTTSRATAGMIPADATIFNVDQGDVQSGDGFNAAYLPFNLFLSASHSHRGTRTSRTAMGVPFITDRWSGTVAVNILERLHLYFLTHRGFRNFSVPSCFFCKPAGSTGFQPVGADNVVVPFTITTAQYGGDKAWITLNWSMSEYRSNIYISTVAVEEPSSTGGGPGSDVPEPSTAALAFLALGAVGVAALRRRKQSIRGNEEVRAVGRD